MAAKKSKAKKKGKAGGRGRWRLFVALAVPVLAIAFYMLYQANSSFATLVDGKVEWVKGLVKGAAPASQPGDTPLVKAADPPHGPPSERTRLPLPADEPSPGPQPVIPRQQEKKAESGALSLSVREAQAVARRVFGGTVVASNTRPGGEWYELTLEGGKKRLPYDANPVRVSVLANGLSGVFVKGVPGMALVLRVSDPSGPIWTSTYAGVTVLAGTPVKPGRVLGSSAMQSPQGRPVRFEALDVEGDGTLEVALELESDAPGGYLVRDFALHSFKAGATRTLFSTRTLDDGPGVPVDEADFKTVGLADVDSDGTLDLVVEEGKRFYHIREDLTRQLKREKTTATRRWSLQGGRYKLAGK